MLHACQRIEIVLHPLHRQHTLLRCQCGPGVHGKKPVVRCQARTLVVKPPELVEVRLLLLAHERLAHRLRRNLPAPQPARFLIVHPRKQRRFAVAVTHLQEQRPLQLPQQAQRPLFRPVQLFRKPAYRGVHLSHFQSPFSALVVVAAAQQNHHASLRVVFHRRAVEHQFQQPARQHNLSPSSRIFQNSHQMFHSQ